MVDADMGEKLQGGIEGEEAGHHGGGGRWLVGADLGEKKTGNMDGHARLPGGSGRQVYNEDMGEVTGDVAGRQGGVHHGGGDGRVADMDTRDAAGGTCGRQAGGDDGGRGRSVFEAEMEGKRWCGSEPREGRAATLAV